jgi:septin 7
VLSTALLGTKRPKPKKMWTHRFVKILVIGDSGLGKTTLIRCLLGTPGDALTLHDGSSTNFTEFRKNPQKYVSKVEWDDDDGQVHWTYQAWTTCLCAGASSSYSWVVLSLAVVGLRIFVH